MTSKLYSINDDGIEVYFLYKNDKYIEFPSFDEIEAITANNKLIEFNVENLYNITNNWSEFYNIIFEKYDDDNIIIKNKEYEKTFIISSWDDLYNILLDMAREYEIDID